MITVEIYRPVTATETIVYEYESIEDAKADIKNFIDSGGELPDKDPEEHNFDDFGDVPLLEDWGDLYIDGKKVASYEYDDGIKKKSWDSKVLGDMYD